MKRSYISHSSLYAKKSGKNILKLLLILFILNSGMLWIHNQRAYAAGVSPQAVTVYGQGGSFTTATTGITSTTLNSPRAIAFDSGGNSYVADYNNNRVLYYPAGTTTATRVYGQAGSFTTATVNNGGVSATSLNAPFDVVLDSSGNLYIADNSNHRVLYYAVGSTTATRVYGQGGSFTSNTLNLGGVTANSLNNPNNIGLDNSGNLYIADSGNHRVLYYAAGSTTATRVYGQGGSFTSNTLNLGGISATSLNNPQSPDFDNSGNVYITDNGNNRVLYYAGTSTTATRVYGQGGSFTSNTDNLGGISATSLSGPRGVNLDSANNVYIADFGNNRALYYPSGSTTATHVYGQGGSFTTNTVNAGGISAASLSSPLRSLIDNSGNLYILDMSNNRVLEFQTRLNVTSQPPASTAVNSSFSSSASLVDVGSTGVFTDFTGTVSVAIKSGTGTTGATLGGTTSTAAVSGIATFSNLSINISGYGYMLTMSSIGVVSGNSSAFTIAGTGINPQAITVYGQGGSFANASSGTTTTTLSGPRKVIEDNSGGLYVSECSNNRVLYYPSGNTTATRVYGQGGSFTTGAANTGGVSANSLYCPTGLALDSSGDLYVADDSNNRVLYYAVGSTTATRVYGQGGSFTTNAINTVSATSLNNPNQLGLDSSGDLYVADLGNDRVLYYTVGSTTATRVYGQGGSFTTNTVNNGGISANSLYLPEGVAVDSSGNLYVTEYYNNRVLYYPSGSTTATRVYGQGGSFTKNTANNGGVSAISLSMPTDVTVDSGGNLYVADAGNNRVLYYPSGSTTAIRVYGQGGNFIASAIYTVSNTSFNTPYGVTVDSSGNLYIADENNNRVLRFQTALSVTSQPPTSTVIASSLSTSASLVDVGSGGVFTDFTGAVSVSIQAGTGTSGAVLSGTTPVSAGSGVVTFSNLSINLNGTGYILTTSSPGVGSANTSAFAIVAAALTPAGYWKLDGGSGTVAIDSSGNNDPGAITGASWTTGQVNGALSFNGTSNYVSMGNPTALQFGTGSFTVMSWFKTTSTAFQRMVNMGANNWSNGFELSFDETGSCPNSTTGCVTAAIGAGGTGANSVSFGTTTHTYADGNWHQAALVVDQTGNTAQLYVDGVVQSVTERTGTCTSGTAVTSISISGCNSLNATGISTEPFTVGALLASGTPSNFFAGGLDEVRTYNSALSSAQIQSRYTIDTTPTTPTAAGYWKLDDGSGTSASDSSSNNNAGTVTGAAWTTGKVNGALSFSGTSNYVSMGTPTALKFGMGSFTVMSWFKTTGTAMGRMVSMGLSSFSTGFNLGVNTTNTCSAGCVGAELGGGSQATSVSFGTTATTFNNGNWHQAAMVIDQTANTAQLYVDGVVQALSIQTGTCGTVSGTSVNITACGSASATNSTDPFTVGNYRSAGGTNSFPFTGSLDEVRVYGSALSSGQIQSQYGIDTMPSPSGYWPFDEDSGTTAYDSSSNHNNGTLTSGPTWTAGAINSGLGFNGSNNYVTMSTPSTLEFNNSSFTVATWFNSTATLHNRFVGSGLASYGAGFELGLNTFCTGCVGGDLGANGTAANTVPFATTTTFNDGKWHHAIMVIDQTAKTAQIYVDGVAQPLSKLYCGTVSGTSINFSACASVNTYSTTEPFIVGAYKGTGGFNEGFSGSLDEVHVYGSALSSAQSLNLYTNDINALSAYAADATFSGTVGTTAGYTLPISLAYRFTPAPGWNLSITSTTLTSGADTLPTTSSTITSVTGSCTTSGTCSSDSLTNTISSFPMTLPIAPTTVKFLGTIAGSGTGAYTITATIAVKIPATAKTGTYTSTITLTAANGP